ncbi:hypothetical protein DITRI_Ditri14bG0148100 [Diplodiscus trichospermus]
MQIISVSKKRIINLIGRNTTDRLDKTGPWKIHSNCYNPQAEVVRSFTYFRMDDSIFRVENWNNFVPFYQNDEHRFVIYFYNCLSNHFTKLIKIGLPYLIFLLTGEQRGNCKSFCGLVIYLVMHPYILIRSSFEILDGVGKLEKIKMYGKGRNSVG